MFPHEKSPVPISKLSLSIKGLIVSVSLFLPNGELSLELGVATSISHLAPNFEVTASLSSLVIVSEKAHISPISPEKSAPVKSLAPIKRSAVPDGMVATS